MSAQPLPHWATEQEHNDGITKLMVDPNVAYPFFIAQLGLEVDQYSAEVALRCVIQALKEYRGDEVYIHILPRENWALRNLPPGLGIARGNADAGVHYKRLTSLTGN